MTASECKALFLELADQLGRASIVRDVEALSPNEKVAFYCDVAAYTIQNCEVLPPSPSDVVYLRRAWTVLMANLDHPKVSQWMKYHGKTVPEFLRKLVQRMDEPSPH